MCVGALGAQGRLWRVEPQSEPQREPRVVTWLGLGLLELGLLALVLAPVKELVLVQVQVLVLELVLVPALVPLQHPASLP